MYPYTIASLESSREMALRDQRAAFDIYREDYERSRSAVLAQDDGVYKLCLERSASLAPVLNNVKTDSDDKKRKNDGVDKYAISDGESTNDGDCDDNTTISSTSSSSESTSSSTLPVSSE